MNRSVTDRWRELMHQFVPASPPMYMSDYVPPPDGVATSVANKLNFDPSSRTKYLLVGALGCGKSTALRQIAAALRSSRTVVEVDLVRSGVSALTVSAFDLLYIISGALIRQLPTAAQSGCFEQLQAAYEPDAKRRQQLGGMTDVLDSIAGFATTAGALAIAAGLSAGAAPLVAAAALVAGKGLTLAQSDRKVVEEDTPQGRKLAEVASTIAALVRQAQPDRPVVVLLDGLERMNGESEARLREVFEWTSLIANADWAAVIAAPPATVTAVNSLDGRGYTTHVLYGFPRGSPLLVDALRLRVERVGASDLVAPDALEVIASLSGGFPRHAITIMHGAVESVGVSGQERLTREHTAAAADNFGKKLAMSLNSPRIDLLAEIQRTGQLPDDDEAASLFAHALVLARPPRPGTRRPVYEVQPLLEGDLRDPGASP